MARSSSMRVGPSSISRISSTRWSVVRANAGSWRFQRATMARALLSLLNEPSMAPALVTLVR